ncbi:hypothetical protein [Bacillus cereus]|uniref:hypothetical protein n=1 Tax=Bacillus cereus TaxID=1396 RepID=UPI00077AC344|nr:hypothetical protein [Bacillus cereus]KXY95157.1 hypothetical protein AT279_21810 [Bacillus cereus]MCU4880395.1 hypothetical protein [Bacillus cereus]MCU5352489.1 hypothetical protein [Bacillus cereus]SMD95401.1 hypothetical protein BACERE00187_02408 [Bacillus cereus]
MPKYKKKPVVVEAFHLTEFELSTLYRDNEALCQIQGEEEKGTFAIYPFEYETANGTVEAEVRYYNGTEPDKAFAEVETAEGTMRANIGDYIITGVNGEKYPCKADIFEKTYELVEE